MCRWVSLHVPVGAEHIYRNPRTEVQRLLEKYHRGHYKVYNFANEPGRTYPGQLFQGRVERFVLSYAYSLVSLVSLVFGKAIALWYDVASTLLGHPTAAELFVHIFR